MKYLPTFAAGLLIGAAALQFSTAASGQGDGWIKLIDGHYKAADWSEVGKANWEAKDGALMADKLDGKDPSYLVSKDSYKDFMEPTVTMRPPSPISFEAVRIAVITP